MEGIASTPAARSVFIVEEDVERARFLSQAFERAGWRASRFRDGMRALSVVVHDQPSLLLVGMGNGRAASGWILLKLLRETLRSTRHIPVVVYAAPGAQDAATAAWLAEQAIPTVSATISADELLRLADSLLRGPAPAPDGLP